MPDLEVEVVHAGKQVIVRRSYRLSEGARIADALEHAAADPAFAGIDVRAAPVGVFGRLGRPEDLLRHGDRVEIYRPLEADPKVARRARARRT